MSIEVITGPMFSGKTEELVRLCKRVLYAKQRLRIYQPSRDTRTRASISSRNGSRLDAIVVENAEALWNDYYVAQATEGVDVVAIDEAQFFDSYLPWVCAMMSPRVRVIVAGLDLDYRGLPFGPMPQIMAMADSVRKLTGVCMRCHSEKGTRTQRLIAGKPAPFHGPLIMIGDDEYEVRCARCHEIDYPPTGVMREYWAGETNRT